MSLPVIESTSTANGTAGSITITKPTGLAVGDVMVAVLSAARSSATNPFIQTASGWTLVATEDPALASASVQWKTATSGDVAASNFTFSCLNTTSVIMSGAILRVTGLSTVSPYIGEISSNTVSAVVDTTVTFSGSVDIAVDNCLVVMAIAATESAAPASVSAYNTTPTVTFTELYDYNNSTNIGLGGAYGIQDTAATITQFGATLSTAQDTHAGVLAIFRAYYPSSGTNALLSVSPVIQTQNGVVGGVGTNSLLAVSPTFPTQSGTGSVPTTWTTVTKN
jgi:hypothetical protein